MYIKFLSEIESSKIFVLIFLVGNGHVVYFMAMVAHLAVFDDSLNSNQPYQLVVIST